MALAGEPPDTNEQVFDASVLPVNALEALGVRFVITTGERTDLALAASDDDDKLYRVPDPAPRANFFADNQVEFAPAQQIPTLFAASPVIDCCWILTPGMFRARAGMNQRKPCIRDLPATKSSWKRPVPRLDLYTCWKLTIRDGMRAWMEFLRLYCQLTVLRWLFLSVRAGMLCV